MSCCSPFWAPSICWTVTKPWGTSTKPCTNFYELLALQYKVYGSIAGTSWLSFILSRHIYLSEWYTARLSQEWIPKSCVWQWDWIMCSKYRQHSMFNSEHNGEGLCKDNLENLHFKMYHKDVSPTQRHSKNNLPSYSQWESIVIDMNPKGSEILLQTPEAPSTWIVRILYNKKTTLQRPSPMFLCKYLRKSLHSKQITCPHWWW